MVQLWTVMTMAIAFANSDMRAENVISVKRDSQAANVMNANRISLVTSVMNANQLISIIHCVKVSLSKFLFLYIKINLYFPSQNVFVTLMARLLWNVMKTMVNALAKMDILE